MKIIQPLDIGVVREIRLSARQAVKKDGVPIGLDPTDSGADMARLEHELMAAKLDDALRER